MPAKEVPVKSPVVKHQREATSTTIYLYKLLFLKNYGIVLTVDA
jgi:hypothetical protein